MPSSSDPLVTVYITNHNYGRFLDQAIQSVLKQTLQEFELIIIDDGSTDNSRELIGRYEGHKKVTTIFQKNKGLNVSNNIAMRTARGRYIMRLDADDYLDEHALMVMAGILEREQGAGLVFPDYFLVDECGSVIEVIRRHDFEKVTLMDQPAHGACTMIRRKCLLDVGGYNESFRCQDGYDLWIRFIKHFGVQNVNLPLFYYRQHRKSLTSNETSILDTRARIIESLNRNKEQKLDVVSMIPVRGKVHDPSSAALRNLGDRKLIDWTIDSAISATRLSSVIVTTPDDEVIDHVTGKYAEQVNIIKREPRLALPNTYIEDTLIESLTRLEGMINPPDAIAVLYIECPFRTHRHIDSAIEIMELFETDSVIGVRPETDIFYQHNGEGLIPIRKTKLLRLEREEIYRDAGRIHLVRRKFLEENRQIVGGRVGHIVIDRKATLSLMSNWDWILAEKIIHDDMDKDIGV